MTQITTLIPAYKKEYLGDLFLALRRQSFKDFKVIVSDDSPGGVITDMIRNRHWGNLTSELNITVVRGPQNARRNHEQLLDLWGGQTPLVHFNLDDDIIYPEFYRTHVAAHMAAPCCATVSQRWLSHDDGVPAWTLSLPDFVLESNGHVLQPTTEELFNSTVGTCQNWLGELSNMVLSAEGAHGEMGTSARKPPSAPSARPRSAWCTTSAMTPWWPATLTSWTTRLARWTSCTSPFGISG
ncbi:MAG: glycosyltransferase family 2 protein [Aquabacterium sp.]|nr:glycosyltransferase family 2 protein [Aquabacterium sp.]